MPGHGGGGVGKKCTHCCKKAATNMNNLTLGRALPTTSEKTNQRSSLSLLSSSFSQGIQTRERAEYAHSVFPFIKKKKKKKQQLRKRMVEHMALSLD